MGEHSWQDSLPPISLYPGPGQDVEDWSVELHTRASPTNAFGTIDFEDTAARVCRAKVSRFINCIASINKYVEFYYLPFSMRDYIKIKVSASK